MSGAFDSNNGRASSKPRFNPWRVYAVCVLTCAGLSAGGYALGVAPAMSRAAQAESDRVELADRKQRAADLTAQVANSRADLAATREALVALPLRLEPAALVNERIAKLTDMASDARLSVSEIRPGIATEGRDFDSVPITIAGTGSYPACADFLHRLHDRFPDTAVRSFRAGQAEGGTASFSVDLVWHTARRK
jgi:Tfp pilus assembly protein PilO